MNFKPNVANVCKVNFRPYMIECGFDYYNTAVTARH